MWTILIAFIVVAVLSQAAIDQSYSDFLVFISGFMFIASCVGLLFVGYLTYFWVGSQYQANIINREYGKNYTREEIFYASDVIDTIRELDRKRVELNGDLITGQKKEAK